MSQSALAGFWHPIATVYDITDQPKRFTVVDY